MNITRTSSLTTGATPAAAPLQQDGAWRPAIALALVCLLLGGLGYAAAATGIAAALFPQQAGGSLLRDTHGTVRASAWLAQPFADERYFQSRPSAAGYDPMAAAGSNLARSNVELARRVAATTAVVAAREGVPVAHVPADLVTQSGSGLDPDISLAAAQLQVHRVARARGLPDDRMHALLHAHTQAADWLGPARVNVVRLNLALDTAAAQP